MGIYDTDVNREFTLILSVISRLYGALIHAYSIHESTLIRCVNARLYESVNYHLCGCVKCTLVQSDSEDHLYGF